MGKLQQQIRCAQRRTDEQRESACKDQRQQQTVDHTTHRMGKCGSKNPLNEDHRGADQGIFSSVEIIVNRQDILLQNVYKKRNLYKEKIQEFAFAYVHKK